VHPKVNPGYAYEFAHPLKKILRVPVWGGDVSLRCC